MTQRPVVMWFRQDLRLSDNAALRAAVEAGPLICLYVLDDATPGEWTWGGASGWWLHKSLERLSASLARHRVKLVLRRGAADEVVAGLMAETDAQAVYFTRDYAPWSAALEQRIKAAVEQRHAAVRRYGGFLLHEPETIRTGQGEAYKVFTPFARACLASGDPEPPRPQPRNFTAWTQRSGKRQARSLGLFLPIRPDWAKGFSVRSPGEEGARQRLYSFLEDALTGYADGRDRMDLGRTSRLSPHLHWGEISPGQCWTAVRDAMAKAHGRLDRDGEKFLSELLWREFSYHLLHHRPDLPTKPFQTKFRGLPLASRSRRFGPLATGADRLSDRRCRHARTMGHRLHA